MRTGSALASHRLYDLSAALSPKTPRSADHPEVRFEAIRWYSRDGAHTSTVHASVHAGTHIDAPALYFPTGATIDEVGLDRLTGSAAMVHLAKKEWEEITVADITEANPHIRQGDIVVLHTGWHREAVDEERYILKAPGLGKNAIDWLIDKGVKLICSDSPSPEHIYMRAGGWRKRRPDIFGDVAFSERDFPPHYGHRSFLAAGICLLEGLGGEIDDLTQQRVELIAMPVKYKGVEAAPATVVALA